MLGIRNGGRAAVAGGCARPTAVETMDWQNNLDAALERAKSERKFVFLDVFNPG